MGWLLKWTFFQPYLFKTIVGYPYLIDFFPPFFRSAHVAQLFYVLPLLSLPALVRPFKLYFYCAAAVMLVSSVMLLFHQDTCNDATFITSFWTSVWFLWFVSQMHRQDEDFYAHARSLALCVVGVVFWGGFIGKMTPEYWNGTVLADIFMEQNWVGFGSWVRSHFSEPAIRVGFQWAAKMIILGEGMLALSPVWPYRLVCWVGIPFMLGISLFTTWLMFSVLFCLMGLLLAGLQLKSSKVH